MGDEMVLQYLGIGFVAGILAGVGLFTFFIAYQTRRIVKDVKAGIEEEKKAVTQDNAKLKQEIDKKNRFNKVISGHIDQAAKIIETQNNIAAAMRQPSQNALHSKHKNKMIGDWKILEDKKQEIFSSILKTGADPIVNVYDDTIKKTREMKLSELMKMMGSNTIPLDDGEADKKLTADAGKDANVTKVVKNGRVFHIITNNGNKTSH